MFKGSRGGSFESFIKIDEPRDQMKFSITFLCHVFTPYRTQLKYSSLCRKSGHLALSHQILVQLLGVDPSKNGDQPIPSVYPEVTFAYMKHMWKSGQKDEAYKNLHHFVFNTLSPAVLQQRGMIMA